jgi:prevent-host-death family protein
MANSSHHITAFDAKNRLGQMLDRVKAGEELVITRHGEPVAMLVPIAKKNGAQVAATLARFKQLRDSLKAKGVTATRDEIREWINEGRR